MTDSATEIEFALREYEAAKAEILARQNHMDSLIGVEAVIFLGAFAAADKVPELLLAAGLMSLTLWIAFMNRQKGVLTLQHQVDHQLEPMLGGDMLTERRQKGVLSNLRSFPIQGRHPVFLFPALLAWVAYAGFEMSDKEAGTRVWVWGSFLVLSLVLAVLGIAMRGQLGDLRAATRPGAAQESRLWDWLKRYPPWSIFQHFPRSSGQAP